MDLPEIMAKYASNVRELRFGNRIKLVRVSRSLYRDKGCHGWMLMIEGVMGGHTLDFGDGFLYNTQGKSRDVFHDPNFFTENLEDAIAQAEALIENLDSDQQVVNPTKGFISRFLNPGSTEHLMRIWAESDLQVISR